MQISELKIPLYNPVPMKLNFKEEQPAVQKIPLKEEATEEIKQSFTVDEMDKVVEELNKQLNIFNARMSFSYDEENRIIIAKIQDRRTGEIIKQFPPEEMLKAMSKISMLVGFVVDKLI